jgi:hypothetical protein
MARKSIFFLAAFSTVITIWMGSCVHEPYVAPKVTSDGNYPADVAAIITRRCVDGCHDQANYKANDGLLLDTWDHMFNGSSHGAAVIPYSPEYSSLLYFINTDSTTPGHDPVAKPTMPYNENAPYDKLPLNKEEYNTIKTWIVNGCPDKNGNIPFASNASTRQKIYMSMQGCNLLAVIDAERKVVMRYIKIGKQNDKAPHAVHVSPNGQYVYVCFSADASYMQKINTTTDQVESDINLNQYFGQIPGYVPGYKWNAFNISKDDSNIAVSDLGNSGKLMLFNTFEMKDPNPITSGLHNLHGVTRFHGATRDEDTFYVTSQIGNAIYKIWHGGNYPVSLNSQPPIFTDSANGMNPHDIIMSPDESKYFVTCQGANQVVVMDAHLDVPLATMNVGKYPQEMAISKSKHYLFVTCTEDPGTTPGGKDKGSVYVFNYDDYSLVKVLSGVFYQPHGIAVDDKEGVLYVPSRNADTSGFAPHHTSACGNGRPGFMNMFNTTTWEPVGVQNELSPDPYSADVRFK